MGASNPKRPRVIVTTLQVCTFHVYICAYVPGSVLVGNALSVRRAV